MCHTKLLPDIWNIRTFSSLLFIRSAASWRGNCQNNNNGCDPKKFPPCRLHLRTLRFVLRVTFTHIARLYRNLHWINIATIVKYLAGAYFMQKFQIARGEIWFSIKKYANVPIVSPRLEVRQISGRSKSILEADHDKVDVWVAVSHLWSRLYLSDQQEKYK